MSLSAKLSRGEFLRGRSWHRPISIRPPWALAAAQFYAACRQCDDCLGVCPESIIVRDEEGYPQVDFQRGGCSFCGQCAEACPHGALVNRQGAKPWPLLAELRRGCLAFNQVTCRSCAEQCAPGALRVVPVRGGMFVPVLDESACSGCGSCVSVCPLGAIRIRSPATGAAQGRAA